MAYNPQTADLARRVLLGLLAETDALAEIKMFGGLCFTVNTRMVIGVLKDQILIRMPTDVYDRELHLGNVTPMDFTGKPLRNFAFLDRALSVQADTLQTYVAISLAYSRTVPSRKRR